jgi:hypothetical protein
MRNLAVATLALLGTSLLGCWYDRPNPWKTESDRVRYLDKREEDWKLEMKDPYDLPQHQAPTLAHPDLEAFRDTVLVNADAGVLLRMRDQSVAKVAALEARAASMAPINENTKVPIYELLWAARMEKLRLQLIDERLSSAR